MTRTQEMPVLAQRQSKSRRSSVTYDVAMVVFLGQRYGDGLVYLRGGDDRALLKRAFEDGLVNEEGYLTPAGLQFWQSKQSELEAFCGTDACGGPVLD